MALHDVFRGEHYTLDRNNMLPTGVFVPGGGVFTGNLNTVSVNRSQRHFLRFENDLFNQLEATWKVAGAGIQHKVLVGLEVGRQSADGHTLQYNAPAVALIDPVLTDVLPGAAPASNTATTARSDTAGLYLQDQLGLAEHWKALVGARLDYYQVSQQNLMAPFNQLGSLNREISPRVGLIYEPATDLSIYGTYSQSFSPAAGDGISTAANTQALSPLKATNYEIGMKQAFLGDTLSATAALFQLTRDITETSPVTNLTTTAGQQRSRGLDLVLAGRLTKRWSVSASYELIDPIIVNGGKDSAGILLDEARCAVAQAFLRNSASAYTTADLGDGFQDRRRRGLSRRSFQLQAIP